MAVLCSSSSITVAVATLQHLQHTHLAQKGQLTNALHFAFAQQINMISIVVLTIASDRLWCSQADIVHLLNDALDAEYTLEDPWTAFKLGSALSRQEQGAGANGTASQGQPGAEGATGTLLQGIELPSDTDDSSFRWAGEAILHAVAGRPSSEQLSQTLYWAALCCGMTVVRITWHCCDSWYHALLSAQIRWRT